MIPLLIGVGVGVAAIVGAIWGANELGLFEGAKGKTLVFVGPRGTGKTTWRTFLSEGRIPKGYQTTQYQVEDEVKLEDVGLHVKIVDMPGGDTQATKWHEQAKDADHIYYFIDLSRVHETSHRERIFKDARIMSLWKDVTAPVTLAVTHADLDSEWDGRDQDAIAERAVLAEMRQRLGASHVVVGNLNTKDGCRRFTMTALGPMIGGHK